MAGDWGKRAHELILDIEDVLQMVRLADGEESLPTATLREAFEDIQLLVHGYLRDYALCIPKPFETETSA